MGGGRWALGKGRHGRGVMDGGDGWWALRSGPWAMAISEGRRALNEWPWLRGGGPWARGLGRQAMGNLPWARMAICEPREDDVLGETGISDEGEGSAGYDSANDLVLADLKTLECRVQRAGAAKLSAIRFII